MGLAPSREPGFRDSVWVEVRCPPMPNFPLVWLTDSRQASIEPRQQFSPKAGFLSPIPREKQSASRSRHAIMEIVNLRRGVRGVTDTNSDQDLAPKRAAKLTAKQERFAKLIVQ